MKITGFEDEFEGAAEKGEGLLSRINHPIFGAFVGSWLVWNWEIVYTLIRGLGDSRATIVEIINNYLNVAHLSSLIWIPLGVTVSLLIVGPIFGEANDLYKATIKALGKWGQIKIEGVEPVPKFQLTNSEEQIRTLEREKRSLEQAYNYIEKDKMIADVTGAKRDIRQIIDGYNSFAKQVSDLQRKCARLEGELQMVLDKNNAKGLED